MGKFKSVTFHESEQRMATLMFMRKFFVHQNIFSNYSAINARKYSITFYFFLSLDGGVFFIILTLEQAHLVG